MSSVVQNCGGRRGDDKGIDECVTKLLSSGLCSKFIHTIPCGAIQVLRNAIGGG